MKYYLIVGEASGDLHETAEVADGVDSGNASGRSRAAEEQGWHAPQRGF